MRRVHFFITVWPLVVIVFMWTRSLAQDEWFKLKVEDFNFTRFSTSIEAVDKHLRSFRAFAELLAKNCNLPKSRAQGFIYVGVIPGDKLVIFKVYGKDLQAFTSLDWDVQNIGFPNFVTAIKGYGLVSQKEILELKLENLKLKGASQDEISETQAALDELQKQLQDFLSKGSWVD